MAQTRGINPPLQVIVPTGSLPTLPKGQLCLLELFPPSPSSKGYLENAFHHTLIPFLTHTPLKSGPNAIPTSHPATECGIPDQKGLDLYLDWK